MANDFFAGLVLPGDLRACFHIDRDTQGYPAFAYQLEGRNAAYEYRYTGRHLVPSSTGIWSLSYHPGIAIRHMYLFPSVAEAACFCFYHKVIPANDNPAAFAALGILPRKEQAVRLLRTYPKAKIHIVFPRDIFGRITDCRMALWLRGKDASFYYYGDHISIRYEDRQLSIPSDVLTMSRLERLTGFRPKIRTHKVKGKFNSFLERRSAEADPHYPAHSII